MDGIVRALRDSTDDLAAARYLWEQCFPEDSKAFVDWFFENAYRPQHCLGVFNGRLLVAGLHMREHTFVWHEKKVKVMLVVGVGTLPAYRNQGLAKRVIAAAFEWMRGKGISVCVLYPAQDYFYERFDFVTVAQSICFSFGSVPVTPQDLQTICPGRDAVLLLPIYEKALRLAGSGLVRDRGGMQSRLHEWAADGGKLLLAGREEEPVAYGLCTLHGDTLHVEEWVDSQPQEALLLQKLLSKGWKTKGWIPKAQQSVAWDGLKTESRPGTMLRVVDAAALAGAFPQLRSLIEPCKITDAICPWNQGYQWVGGMRKNTQEVDTISSATLAQRVGKAIDDSCFWDRY